MCSMVYSGALYASFAYIYGLMFYQCIASCLSVRAIELYRQYGPIVRGKSDDETSEFAKTKVRLYSNDHM